MWEWIIKYWIQIVFGAIAAGFGLLAKKFWKMYQNEKEHDVEANMQKCYAKVKDEIQGVEDKIVEKELFFGEEIKKVHAESLEYDQKIEADIESVSNYIEVLKDGVLAVQGAHFRQQCKAILDSPRIISVDEFEQLAYDHKIYNRLGGNHLGDSLFTAVEARFKAQQLSTPVKVINKV